MRIKVHIYRIDYGPNPNYNWKAHIFITLLSSPHTQTIRVSLSYNLSPSFRHFHQQQQHQWYNPSIPSLQFDLDIFFSLFWNAIIMFYLYRHQSAVEKHQLQLLRRSNQRKWWIHFLRKDLSNLGSVVLCLQREI
jgi:hypothetical protein